MASVKHCPPRRPYWFEEKVGAAHAASGAGRPWGRVGRKSRQRHDRTFGVDRGTTARCSWLCSRSMSCASTFDVLGPFAEAQVSGDGKDRVR